MLLCSCRDWFLSQKIFYKLFIVPQCLLEILPKLDAVNLSFRSLIHSSHSAWSLVFSSNLLESIALTLRLSRSSFSLSLRVSGVIKDLSWLSKGKEGYGGNSVAVQWSAAWNPSNELVKEKLDSVKVSWYEPSPRSKHFRGAKSEKRGFRCFARAKNGVRAKTGRRGVGEGSKGNACGQTPWFWKPLFASEWSSWLAGLVKHYWHVSIKGLKVPSAGKNIETLFTKSL